MARTLTVYLAADTSKFTAKMKHAGDAIDGPDGFHGKINALGIKLSESIGPAMATAAAAAGAFALQLGVEGVKAAMDAEAKFSAFSKTMTNMGWADQTPAAKEFVDQIARITLWEDDELLKPLQDLAVAIGGEQGLNKAMGAMPGLMDTAQGSGKALESVVSAVSKAVNGKTTALERMFPWLDKTAVKSGDLDSIVGALSKTFAGAATEAALTYEGKIKNTAKAFDELKESFGQGFLDGLTNAGAGVDTLANKMYDRQKDVKDFGTELGKNLTTLTGIFGALGDVKTGFDEWTAKMGPWGDVLKKFVDIALNPVMAALSNVLNTIDTIKREMANMNTVHASANGPGDVSVLKPPSQPAANAYVGSTIGSTAKPMVQNITVNATVADPVAVARAVSRASAIAATRLGSAFG